MKNALYIDFEKINQQVQDTIESANQETTAENPNANIKNINDIADIARAVCLTMLQDYHAELCRVLKENHTIGE